MNKNSGTTATGKVKSQTIEAVITRADGTKEYLGVISFWHRNPLIRWGWKLKKLILEIVYGRRNNKKR